jgi:mono/diheme cytochrome c family protein
MMPIASTFTRIFASGLLILSSCLPALTAAPQMDAETLAAIRIQPLLKEKCLACHGDDPDKIKADYDMRSAESLLQGGESGQPAIVPGQPDDSPLYLSVLRTHEHWEAMPPKENDALSSQQVQWIKDWITAGAPWPDDARRAELTAQAEKWLQADGITVRVTGALSDDWANRRYKPEDLWAYQPLQKPTVPTTNSPSTNPIDHFIQAALPPGLEPAPAADAHTLQRRLAITLTGLPPTADAPSDPSDLLEHLLASPHYGERIARHWLDVVRYADSSGFANDYERGNTWRYRDYVIRAFNADKPYDQFIREQVAGDEIAPQDPEMLVATGFLRMGPWELTGMEVAKIARQRFLDDVTNAVGITFLGQALECARCHDHKFDPIPTHDYYAIQAVFATTQLSERPAAFLPQENTAHFEEKAYLEKRRAEHLAELNRLDQIQIAAARQWFQDQKIDPTAFETALAQPANPKAKGRELSAFNRARNALQAQKEPEAQIPPRHIGFGPEEYGRERVARKGLERLSWEFERYQPIAFSVYNGKTPDLKSVTNPQRPPAQPMAQGELEQTAILGGGDPFSPTTPVQPSVLSVIASLTGHDATLPSTPEGRRRALAEWIASPRNPLTARVIANRVWLWHFGQPLAGNPNNFGGTGKKPTHPELLDYLASYLIEKNWSLKDLQRLILSSQTWQRSATHPQPELLREKDPLGSSYAAFIPRRLTAEEIRDATLQVSGELNPALGGIPVRPEINLEAALQPRQVMGTFAAAWVPNPTPAQRHRRSIYVQKLRGLADPFMEVFNEPGPDFSCEQRDASTVTPQVFSLFNSQNTAHRALALAARSSQNQAEPTAAIQTLFRLTHNRPPNESELQASLTHYQNLLPHHQKNTPPPIHYPTEIIREAVEENTGETFTFTETLHAYNDFIPDRQPTDTTPEVRTLAEIALVLLNSNEFVYLY